MHFHAACESFMHRDVIRGLQMSAETGSIFMEGCYERAIFSILKAFPWKLVPHEPGNLL